MGALRGTNSDLLAVEACLGQILQREMLDGMFTMDDVAEAAPAIDLQIRLARQIAQISQLEMRFAPALASSVNKAMLVYRSEDFTVCSPTLLGGQKS